MRQLVFVMTAAAVISWSELAGAAPNPRVTVVAVAPGANWQASGRLASALSGTLTKRGFVSVNPAASQVSKQGLDFLEFRRLGHIAVTRFKAEKYRTAIRALRLAIARLERLMLKYGPADLLIQKYVRAHYYLGAALLKNADPRASAAAFRTAAFYAPSGSPSSRHFDAESINAYKRAKRAMNASTGMLLVRTNASMRLFVDGRDRGLAPNTLRGLPQGRHYVVLFRLGYRRLAKFVDLTSAGTTWKVRVGMDPAQADVRAWLPAVDRELRQRKMLGPVTERLARRFRTKQVILCRASVDEAEASWLDLQRHGFRKRVRRPSPVPGQPAFGRIASALFRHGTVMDLGQNLAAGCLADSDCPGGTCIAGKCIKQKPFYKKWWFWLAIGASVAAAAAAGAVVATMPDKPIVHVTYPP